MGTVISNGGMSEEVVMSPRARSQPPGWPHAENPPSNGVVSLSPATSRTNPMCMLAMKLGTRAETRYVDPGSRRTLFADETVAPQREVSP